MGQSVVTYDHDKLAGSLWSAFVERFYNGVNEAENTQSILTAWDAQTAGWVPDAAKARLTKAITAWASGYYQMFRPDDGCRTQSEVFVENDRFLGYLDGLNNDRIIHETKTTSRSPQLAGQLWKVENSIQIKLYCVLADANGYCVEFGFKDAPHAIFRGPVVEVTREQKTTWETQLNTLADYIYSLGDDPNHYVCNPDSCCLVTRGVTSMCQYMPLCDGVPGAEIAFQERTRRK